MKHVTKVRFNSFGPYVYSWGLVHYGDRYDLPLCRIAAMSSPSSMVDQTELVNCLQCLALGEHLDTGRTP